MIDFLVYHQALIRELINGTAFVLFLTLTIMITVFLWDTWIVEGPLPLNKWNEVPGVKTSCFMWWVFGSEAYRTFNVWFSYVQGSLALTHSSVSSVLGYLLAGVILCGWLLRGIYIFTPPDWRQRVWIYASVGAMVLVSLPTALRIYIDAQ